MAYVIETPNPFEPHKVKHSSLPMGMRIQDWVDLNHPNDFPGPTICMLNGEPVLREQWKSRIVGDKDVVNFIGVVHGFSLILAVVIAAVAIAASLALSMATPGTSDDPQSEPVYSLRGQQNDIRLSEPIECPYGRNRIFPSVAALPWYQYIDNDQYQHSLLCLGHGYYDIDTIQIGDTNITNFDEVEYEVVEPGGSVTLFPTAVYTSSEVGTVEVYAPNEDEYPADGWIGPYVANAPGTVATTIEVDIVFPKGVYWMKQSGSLRYHDLDFVIEIREIDDSGTPIGDWDEVVNVDVSWAFTSPQRRTYVIDLESNVGRYEVRIKRTSEYQPDHPRVGCQMIWEGLRAHLDEEQDWGDVTLLAIKAKATNNLNSTSAKKFNVIATRKLPIYDTGTETWSVPTATRSIIWAFCDVLRSEYGGRITDDSFIDLEALAELADFYDSTDRTEYFDWVFRDRITVWEALQTIARVGRAVPIVKGSAVSMVRNGPLTVPVAMFTPENIIEGSFRWDLKLWEEEEYDSVRVEYTEPSTGYLQETVVASLPDGTSDYPEDIRIPGIQDREHAYREGLFIVARRRYIRENVTFETGLEGYLPTFGDLIAISHDVPRWKQSGYIVDAEYQTGGEWLVTLSEPLDWEETGAHTMLLQDADGSVLGPTSVEEVPGAPQLAILTQPETNDPDFRLGGTSEPMFFIFGTPGEETKLMRITKIEPQGGEAIRITAEPEVALVHSVEDDTSSVPDDLPTSNYPTAPDEILTVGNLTVTQLDRPIATIQVAWPAVPGAASYVVQTSTDNVNWTERSVGSAVSLVLEATHGPYYVRVAAVGSGQGPWSTASLVVTPISFLDTSIPWADVQWEVRWWEALNAAGYELKVYDNTVPSAPGLLRTETLGTEIRSYLYDYSIQGIEDVGVRELLVTVDALFEDPDDPGVLEPSGYPYELELSNDIPDAPTGLAMDSTVEETDGTVYYTLSWLNPVAADLHRVKVWVSDTPGFDPEVVAPVVDEQASAIGSEYVPESAVVSWDLDSDGEHPTLYWRVAVFDVWGNEILEESSGGNLSPEETIPAYV